MHFRSAKRSHKTNCALGAAIERLEPRQMLCVIAPDGAQFHMDNLHRLVKAKDVDPKIPKGSKLWHELHDASPLQDTAAAKPNTQLAALSAAQTQLVGPQTSLVGSQPTGQLTGKVVFTSGGHGYTYTGTAWTTQRGVTNGMVEDMGVQDQMSLYADYLLNAGATVVPMRPVGHQLSQVIVDNTSAGFSIQSGSWTASNGTAYYSPSANGYDSATSTELANHYQFASSALTETAVARFTPTIASTGFYPVYAWWNNGSNRATDATYRINYSGGSYEVRVDQAKVGKGWVYLGTYYFTAGSTGNVELSNKSAVAGKVVIADAIRFGNGMGDWNPGSPGISGHSREDEAALYWLYRARGYGAAGALISSTNVDGGIADDQSANVGAPIRYAAYMNDSTVGAATDRIYLGFHSNAFDGTARGALGLTSSSAPTAHQNDWATKAQAEIQNDLQGIGSPPLEYTFPNHTAVLSGAYGEISDNTIGGEFDATIIEVAFHDNASDAALMKDPKVRDAVARAEYQATVKYFATWPSVTSYTLTPDLPTNVRATTDSSGNVVLNWTAPATNGTTGGAGAATGYKVYSSTNGYGYTLVANLGNVTTYTLAGQPTNAVQYYRIVANNAGGDSKPSNVVAAKPQVGRRAPILIVDNFARMDRPGDEIESSTINGGTATSAYSRVRPRYNNSHDYSVQAASAIVAYNSALGIETATDDAIATGQISLSNYHTVIWLSGEQSSADNTFTATTQPLVSTYLSNGGKMFISGAEIGYELVALNAGASFYQNTLHTNYVSDDAATYSTAAGVAGSALAGVSALSFDDGTHGTYDVGTPDVISAGANASVAMNYSTGSAAVVQYASGNTRILNMGFPFESIYTASQRNSLMSAALTYFGTNSTIVSTTPGAPDLLPITDSGDAAHQADNRTSYNNSSAAKRLQFQISGTVAGATVTLYSGGVAIGSAVASGTTTTVTTNGTLALADGVRLITARQTESGKAESPDSPSLSVTIDTTAPAAPGASSVSSTASSITLDWPNNAESDFQFYDIYRADVSGGPYTRINASPLTSSVYTDSTVAPNQVYYYVVRATDTAGNISGNSAQTSASAGQPVSAAPGSISLDSSTDSGIQGDTLTNFDNSSTAKAPAFVVSGTIPGATVTLYRGSQAIGSKLATGTSTVVTGDGASGIPEGASTITATQTESGKSESASNAGVSITIDTTAPASPATGTLALTGTTVSLDWPDNVENDLRWYQVYRGTESAATGGDYTHQVGFFTTTALTDSSLTPGTHYYYVIRAFDNAGNASAFSAEIDAPTVPTDLSNFTAAANTGRNVNLSWALGSGNRDGVIVERRQGAGAWSIVASLASTATAYADSGLNPNTTYTYRARAFTGSSGSSNTADTTATTYRMGDIDGNGIIDFDDFFYLDRGFASKLTGWSNGDFNDDNVVNQLDYDLAEAAYNAQ
ncbi:MAG TPA: hypothetical protein VF669_10400 [Tepidisphaeraceae bacterium]|jgi:hypothetical protein